MTRTLRSAASCALIALVTGCIHIYEPRPSSGGSSGPAAAAPGGGAPAAAPLPSGMKPWDDVLKDTKPIDGFIKMHRKRDNTLYLEIRPDQIEKEFGLVMHISRGMGVFNVQDGLPLTDGQLMRFRRTGDRIYLIDVNPRFTAAAGSPMKRALDDNVGHSIVAAMKIESEHKESKAVLVDATSFLVSDYANIGEQLKWYYGQKPVMFDKERSYVDKTLSFPKNTEIDALLTFRATDYPPAASAGVSDFRSLPVGVRYSFFALPEQPMQIRYFDDRVGYFTHAIRDFSKDQDYDPYTRMLHRWRLEKKDAGAVLSEPVQPIVYYIDTSVPKEYRKYVKAAIEGWNRAFEKAGFKNAVVAREAPENDSTWSAEDIRYSTIRWTPAHQMGYAIGPSQADPRTGEILNADILISTEFLNGWASEYEHFNTPEAMEQYYREHLRFMSNDMGRRFAERTCMMESGMMHQLGLQADALAAMGVIEVGKPLPEKFLSEALMELLLHEIGHTLGLRHNMKGSSAIPYDKLNDKDFTLKHGLTLSVMDYAPVNIALDSKKQGFYYSPEVGTYDEWAIRYGYTPIYDAPSANGDVKASGKALANAEAERAALRTIASEAPNVLHTYGTDEDTHLGPLSIDPNSNTWDLGSEPMRFAADRLKLMNMIQPKLESRLIADGDGYNRLRGSVNRLVFERYRSLQPVTKTVGGVHFVRDHKGDPNGRSPFTPVSAARQREAVKLIVDGAFAEDAFRFDAALLNKLAPTRRADWSGNWLSLPIDYPIHNFVAMVQGWLLEELLDGARFTRMIDNGVKQNDPYSVAELFETTSNAIWSELGGGARAPRSIDSFRRNLQRRHIDHMTRIMLDVRTPFTNPVPEDARSLARYELTQLNARLGQALEAGRGLDVTTRAHLSESRARIARALDASIALLPR